MASIAVTKQRRRSGVLLIIVTMLGLLGGCVAPVSDREKLRAIRVESQTLIARQRFMQLPKSAWPPTIAALGPDSVTVSPWGVDIVMKPYFDGGWGYAIPKDKQNSPMPEECYSKLGEGVFWHDPC